MSIKYTKAKNLNEPPCLMVDDYNQVYFITTGDDKELFATLINPTDTDDITTTMINDLTWLKSLPKGDKFEFIND